MKGIMINIIILVTVFLPIRISAQCDPQAFRMYNETTHKIEDTWNWNDPNVIYWGSYVKLYGLDFAYFDQFGLPYYLVGQYDEIQSQTIAGINHWDYYGCLDLFYSNNSPNVQMRFSNDPNIFTSSTQYGATANAITGSTGNWTFVYYNASSPTGFPQTTIYFNGTSDFGYQWSLALQNPGPEYAPFKPILLHELGHIVGLGHIINTGLNVMSLNFIHNQFLFQLTTCDINGLVNLCDFNGTPVGVEDCISIESGPVSFSPGNNVTYTAEFHDIPPLSHIYNWDWEIIFYHGEGVYNYISESTTGWNYTEWSFIAPSLPLGYCWFRDENDNVMGQVKVSGTDSDNHYHEAILEITLQNIPTNTTNGSLTHNETWCGYMNITGDVIVPLGITLEILPASNILFESNTSLWVYGTLIADGEPLAKINFKRIGTSGTWGSLLFNSASSSNSILDNVVVKNGSGIRCYSGANITIQNSLIDHCTEGVYFYNSQPTIQNNQIIEPVQNGINGDASGLSPLILHNTITKTSGNPQYHQYQGIILGNNTNGYIAHNDIKGFMWGMYIGGGSDAYFTNHQYQSFNPNNRIKDNSVGIAAGWGGFIFAGYGQSNSRFNSIYNNNYDAYSYKNSDVYAQYNWWGPDGAQTYVDGTSWLDVNNPLTYDPWNPGPPPQEEDAANIILVQNNNPGDGGGFNPDSSILGGIYLEAQERIVEAVLHYKQMVMNNNHPGFALGRLVGIKNRYHIQNIRDYLTILLNGNQQYKPIVMTLFAGILLGEDKYNLAMLLYSQIINQYPNTYYAVNAMFEKFFAALNYENDRVLAEQLLQELVALGLTDEEYLMRLQIAENLLNEGGTEYIGKYTAANQGNIEAEIPKEYSLLGNYPNPFNPSTNISYSLPYQSSVELVIYDIMGRKVKTFNNSSQSAGYQNVIWDGTNEDGASVSTGVYLYRINIKSLENKEVFVKTSKLMLLK